MKAISFGLLAASVLSQDLNPWNPNTNKSKGTTAGADWVSYTLTDST
jgi:hypothetical protein